MNDRRGLLAASVISIQNSCFVYPSCQNCFSKLILDSRRFNCLKCGCAGEAKDANYRYRLSLKVADANDLFHITVFGTCLDPFFGITAGRLQRCIQEAEGADRDESSRALIQAVKTCFIGRRLIFGLKGSKHQDGGPFASDSIFQNCSRINSQTKDLTACQIFLPNTAVAGFTVISYFHRLWQSKDIRHRHSSSYSPDSPLIAIDQPIRELSSSCSSSSNSCFVQSGRESFSGPWQQSFGLTSSSVDWVTTEDVLALELGEDPGKWNKQEERPFSAEPCSIIPSNETVLRVELYNSSRGERREQKDHEFSSPHQQPETDKLESISFLKRGLLTPSSHSRLLHNSLEFEVTRCCPEIASRYDKYQEKSRNSVFHQRQDYSFCCSSLSPDPSSTARVSEDDPMIWDELPFSESLNEFIARIENNKTAEPSIDSPTHKYSLVEIDKGKKNLAKSSQGTGAADFHAVCAAGLSSHLQENVNTCQEPVLSCHQSNLKPVSSKALQHKSLCSLLSTHIKEGNGSCFIANPPLLVQTPVILKPYSEGSFLHSKEASITISKSIGCPTNLKSPVEHGESPYLQRQKHARLHSIRGCLANWENKENSVYPPNQRTDLTSCWATGCSSAALSSTKITGKRELNPLTDLQQKTCRGVNERNLWNGSCPEDSYNASADLFDATGGEKEIAIDFLSKSCNSSAKDYVLTEKHTASELVLSPFDDGCSYSQCQLFLHGSSPAFSKHSTPISYSLYKSELDTVGTPYFIPYSQSTPVARPLQKLRPYRGRDSIFPKLSSKNRTKINSRWKQSRSSFKNTLLRQLTSRLLKHERSSSNPRATDINKPDSQQLFTNSELPENDSDPEEWIPPSATKLLQPAVFSNLKTVGLQAERPSISKHTADELVSENKGSSGTDRRLISSAEILKTPTLACATKAFLLEDAALGACFCSENESCLSCAIDSRGILDIAGNWSPELFTENFQAQKLVFPKPVS